MTKIKTLKRWNKDHTKRDAIAPRTHVKAVYDSNGNTLDSLMAVQDEKLSELGSYIENSEYARAYTDAEGRFLWGIRHDGSIEFAKGVPTPIKNYIVELFINRIDNVIIPEIDTLKGAHEQYLKESESTEWARVIVDAEDRVLMGIKADGTPYIPNRELYHLEDNQEWTSSVVDFHGKLIEATSKDGRKYLPKPTNQDLLVLTENKKNYHKICQIADNIMQANYNIRFANAVEAIPLKSYVGNNQNVHPKVLYFSNRLFGYKFWMAYTPYPWSNDTYENPCVAYSNDGYEWTNIDGNPIVDTPNGGYNSDTHLVYNSTTRLLECWYREVIRGTSEIIYRCTTSNGKTWSAPEKLYQIANAPQIDMLLSPSVIIKDGKYCIWVVSQRNGLHIEYFESSDGKNWNFIKNIPLDFTYNEKTYNPWHIDVIYHDGKYQMIAMCQYNNDWMLFKCDSVDNESYNAPYPVVLPNKKGWDYQLYRTCIVATDSDMRLYYSAKGTNGRWGIGISVAENDNNFIGYNY